MAIRQHSNPSLRALQALRRIRTYRRHSERSEESRILKLWIATNTLL